jgi:uncharacterized linocin/CFP29 family protein
MEFLNRSNAPFSSGVWNVIDETMREFLSKRLNIRSVVDFKSQYSYETDAIATKALKSISNKKGVSISSREPIKMLEIKKSFVLSQSVIEDIKRGIDEFDDKEFAQAANEFAAIENGMIMQGLKEANIDGIINHKEVQSLDVKSTKDILSAVAKSLGLFNKEFVSGDFKLVISSATLAKLYTEFFDGISLKTKLDDILGANHIVVNEDIGDNKALILSQRGGDFEFCSGLDVSIGFEKELKEGVELFLLQTCTLRILSPEAAIVLNLK